MLRARRMRNLLRRPGLWILIGLVAVAAVVLALRARGPTVRTTTPVRRDLEQHLVASGRVRVPTRLQVSTQIPGRRRACRSCSGWARS
jgi:HlyD family secretion protein